MGTTERRVTNLPSPRPDALTRCLQEGGVLLTTPERRLSLFLKRQELWQQGSKELGAALDAVLELPYINLLDESDELLSYR